MRGSRGKVVITRNSSYGQPPIRTVYFWIFGMARGAINRIDEINEKNIDITEVQREVFDWNRLYIHDIFFKIIFTFYFIKRYYYIDDLKRTCSCKKKMWTCSRSLFRIKFWTVNLKVKLFSCRTPYNGLFLWKLTRSVGSASCYIFCILINKMMCGEQNSCGAIFYYICPFIFVLFLFLLKIIILYFFCFRFILFSCILYLSQCFVYVFVLLKNI